MQRLILGLAVACFALVCEQANAAAVYFRGAITTTVGADTLGLNALPSQNFEALVTTNNAGGILGSYIVFQGKSFTFTTGAFGPAAGNNQFSGMNLVGFPAVPSGVLTITLPGPVVADSQAGMDSLIGRVGTAIITIGGTTYIGGITAVPEPASMLVLAGLVVGCGAYRFRKSQRVRNAV